MCVCVFKDYLSFISSLSGFLVSYLKKKTEREINRKGKRSENEIMSTN